LQHGTANARAALVREICVRPLRSRLRWSGLEHEPEERKPALSKAAPAQRGVRPPQSRERPFPDLLRSSARMSIDADALEPQLVFAFAGGDASERIRAILAGSEPEETSWEPESFAPHLFIESWVEHLASLPFGGRSIEADPASLRRILTHPPKSPHDRTFRHEILAELVASTTAAAELVEIYRELRRVRALLTKAPADGRTESTRRRIEFLAAVRATVERMAASFDGARSGLSRVREIAGALAKSEGFARVRDLIDHDRHRATVKLELRLGGDGRVRELTVGKIEEDSANRFHRAPGRRLIDKLLLWIRGYRFSDEELVDHWIDSVYSEISEYIPGFFELIFQIELYLAALAFRERSLERGLAVCLPEIGGEGESFEKLFNPLLLAQGVVPVPCDLSLHGPGTTSIITGPNSGGKTRLLQAIGLAQLLAQSGFFVPAASAKMRAVPYLFCSLVQEDSFDQSEGRLGTELLRIRRMFERAPPGSLIIIDELCSGTNPSEGEEIFTLVISLLRELAPETFVTTHFLDFAHRLEAQAEPLGLFFLRVDLDETQHPTFAFVPGVAPTSLAAQAAARLGVTREELLDLVRRHRSTSSEKG
jgi:DNA mismatch repair protein MutS2